mgnify:CR=1 FL=1
MAAGNHNVAGHFRPGIATKHDAEPAAVFHINPPASAYAEGPLDPGTHARAEGIGRGRMELLRFIGRITLITQGYPHVTVVRIGPGTYGNAGIPYFNMIPQGGSGGVGAHGRGTYNGTPVVSGGRGNLSQHCPCHWRHWHLFRLQRFCPQKGRTYHLNS